MASSNKKLSTVGSRVQELRKQFDMSQSELAQKMGVSRETLNHWESDAREIKATQVLKLAELFNVTCDYLLMGVSTQYVEFYRHTGLKDDAIKQLEDAYGERLQYLLPLLALLRIDYLNYLLSNQRFMSELPARLKAYCEERLEDDELARLSGKLERSDKTKYARCLLTEFMVDIADDCYTNFYRPSVWRNSTEGAF